MRTTHTALVHEPAVGKALTGTSLPHSQLCIEFQGIGAAHEPGAPMPIFCVGRSAMRVPRSSIFAYRQATARLFRGSPNPREHPEFEPGGRGVSAAKTGAAGSKRRPPTAGGMGGGLQGAIGRYETTLLPLTIRRTWLKKGKRLPR